MPAAVVTRKRVSPLQQNFSCTTVEEQWIRSQLHDLNLRVDGDQYLVAFRLLSHYLYGSTTAGSHDTTATVNERNVREARTLLSRFGLSPFGSVAQILPRMAHMRRDDDHLRHVLPPAYEPYEASPLHDEQWRRTRLVDMAPPLDGPPYLSPLVAPDGSPVAHLAEVTPIPHPQPSNWEFRLLPIADLPNRMDLIALTLVVIIVFFQFMCPIRLSIHWG